MLNEIATALLPGLETLLAALGTLVLARATQWIATHAKNAQMQGIMDRLVQEVGTVVAETEQTFVKTLGDAPLTPDQAQKALAAALASLKTHLGPKGIAELKTIFPPDQLEQILVSYIEARVHYYSKRAS